MLCQLPVQARKFRQRPQALATTSVQMLLTKKGLSGVPAGMSVQVGASSHIEGKEELLGDRAITLAQLLCSLHDLRLLMKLIHMVPAGHKMRLRMLLCMHSVHSESRQYCFARAALVLAPQSFIPDQATVEVRSWCSRPAELPLQAEDGIVVSAGNASHCQMYNQICREALSTLQLLSGPDCLNQ